MLTSVIISVSGYISNSPYLTASRGSGADDSNLAFPTCAEIASTTSEDALATMASRGIEEFYGDSTSHQTHLAFAEVQDSDNVYKSRGGDSSAHIYGEVDLSGMKQILHEALRISLGTDKKDVFQHSGDFKFYDLGSGFGKFPMFAAFMGFRESVGIELDSQRAKFAAERWNAMKTRLPSCAHTLKYFEDNILTKDEWARGQEKRVIFMHSLCFDSFWPQLTAKMESAEWGNTTVIASMGKTRIGKFNGRSKIYVKTSWKPKSAVTFLTKCQSTDPSKCGEIANARALDKGHHDTLEEIERMKDEFTEFAASFDSKEAAAQTVGQPQDARDFRAAVKTVREAARALSGSRWYLN